MTSQGDPPRWAWRALVIAGFVVFLGCLADQIRKAAQP